MNNIEYSKWDESLIWCPSQLYCDFIYDGNKYCIYLRWRHNDPWTMELIKAKDFDCEDIFDDGEWYWFKDIPVFKDNEYEELKKYAEKFFNEFDFSTLEKYKEY